MTAALEKVADIETLRERLAELERSNAELSQFAAIASHDIQAPLRKIVAFCELLQKRLPPEDVVSADLATRVIRSGERLSRLVDDLLTLARVTSQARPLETVDLDAVLDDVLSDLAEATAAADASIERRPLPRLRADPIQMRQLFHNLLANALKFRSAQRPLLVKVFTRPADRGFSAIVIEDNGLGVPADRRHLLFEPLQRLHAQDLRDGTGLGLALCRRVALRHGGAIAFESGPMPGSRFVVTLPAWRAAGD